MNYELKDIDLDWFRSQKWSFRYSKEGSREFYEARKGNRAIVIQRFENNPWSLFFIQGDIIRVPSKQLSTKPLRVVCPAFNDFREAFEMLEELEISFTKEGP